MKILFISVLWLATLAASDDTAVQEFARANNLFAASVYKELLKTDTNNFLISPYSAEVILALTQSGSRGDTGEEIRTALHLPDDNSKIEVGVKTSLSAIADSNKLYTLHSANKIYVTEKNNFSIKDEFKKTAVETYGADVEKIDFAKKENAAKTMNEWVESKTNHKIQNLISPDILDDLTRLILINTLYFQGNWSNQFYEDSTQKKNFYKTPENAVRVDMMHQYRKWYNYYESPELDAQFLELPFKSKDVSMVIVLPNKKDGLTDLESNLDKIFATQNFQSTYINIAIPKFKIESTIQLKKILQNLGMKKAFTDFVADLSGIAGEPGDLVIDDVVQKTFIDVREGGVEAAAATYVAVAVPVSAIISPKPKNFIANHPFLFYIKANNFILFAGRVLIPNY